MNKQITFILFNLTHTNAKDESILKFSYDIININLSFDKYSVQSKGVSP